MTTSAPISKDFFISYNSADKTWAEWIAWVLEEHGCTVVIQAWDFRPGGNFVLDMQRATEAERTIMVLSENYLKAAYTQPEWAAAFKQDPESLEHKLLPIRISACKPSGLLAPIGYVDLVGKEAAEAEQLILDALKERAKPSTRPTFPHSVPSEERVTQAKITFPDSLDQSSPRSLQATQPMAISWSTSPPQPNQPLSSLERLTLIKTLNALPSTQFEEILIALNPPRGIVSGGAANQGNRAAQFMQWIEGPTGPGLADLQQILSLYMVLRT